MKAILEFNLPEESNEFELAQKGIDYSIILSELDNWLRNKLKYEELSEEEYTIYEGVRNKLLELAGERTVSLY